MNFSGLTPQMIAAMNNRSGNNYNTAFARSMNVIPTQNFTNMGNIMHNNMGDNLLTEQIEVYTIYADGFHRDTTTYPNPFKFPIEFGRNNVSYNNGTSSGYGVRVDRELIRTKFVRLDGLIIPNYNSMTYNSTDKTFTYDDNDETHSIINKKFIVVKIDQLEDYHKFTSGDFMKNNTFVCRYDKPMGNNHSYWIPITRDSVTYKNSAPKPISKFDVSLYDDEENLLSGLSVSISDTSPPTTFLLDFDKELTNLGKTGTVDTFSGLSDTTSKTKTKEQLLKIKKNHQIHLILSVGVIEHDLNINNM